jgi:aminoglycoside 6'-N-acetyltransferase
VEIGFTLSRRYQGQGLATVAVRAAIALALELTAADRVLGITDARNHASIRLLERVGLRRAETKATVFRGEPCVEHVYPLSRGDG